MRIDLTEALSVDFCSRQTEVASEIAEVSVYAGTFPVTEKSAVRVTYRHQQKGQMEVAVDTSLTLEIPCDRCLQPVAVPFSVHAKRAFDLEDTDLPSYVDGNMLDVDELIFHELLLHWPAKVLCREDCRGICPVCGADLNQGECGCDRQVLDPRMAALEDILNQMQS